MNLSKCQFQLIGLIMYRFYKTVNETEKKKKKFNNYCFIN